MTLLVYVVIAETVPGMPLAPTGNEPYRTKAHYPGHSF